MKSSFWGSPSGKALLVLAGIWGLGWTLGALLVRMNLAWGLAVNELAFIALPAWAFLRREAALKEPDCFRWPRLGKVGWTLLIAVGALWAAVSRGLAVRQVLGCEPMPPDLELGPAALLGFDVVVLAPLCEELLFRAVLLRSFLKEMSARNAVLLSALLFALWHGSLQRLPETFIIGLFLGMVFARSGSYWLAVVLHFVANLLGPGLLLAGPKNPVLFHPLTVLPLALVAVYGLYRLGEPSPPGLKGRRARLAWALFGAPRFSEKQQSLPWVCKGFCTGLASVALGLAVWIYVASGQRPGVMAQGEQEEQVWRLMSAERMLVQARHSSPRPFQGSVRVELPYSQAKIVQAHSESGRLRWKPLGNGKFELVPEGAAGKGRLLATVQKSSSSGAKVAGELTVEYEFPLSALERKANYRIKLYALRPVQRLSTRIVLDPGCRFEFSRHKAVSEMSLFQGGRRNGPPKQFFGTCGFEVQPRMEMNRGPHR